MGRAKRRLGEPTKTAHLIQTMNHWHELLADWLLANPGGTLIEAAHALGKHPQTLSIVWNSSTFQEYWKTRRGEFSTQVDRTLLDKLQGISHLALDRIEKQLQEEPEAVSVPVALQVATKTLEGLGYMGPAKTGASTINVSGGQVVISSAPPDILAAARAKLLAESAGS